MGKLAPPGMTAQGLINDRTLCVATRLADSVTSPEFVLNVKRAGIAARAVQVDGEFTVLAGSGAAGQVRTADYAASTTNAYAAYRNLHQKLADDGSLRLDSNADTATFTRDVVFSSPSTGRVHGGGV